MRKSSLIIKVRDIIDAVGTLIDDDTTVEVIRHDGKRIRGNWYQDSILDTQQLIVETFTIDARQNKLTIHEA